MDEGSDLSHNNAGQQATNNNTGTNNSSNPWTQHVNSLMRNPVVGDIRRAIRSLNQQRHHFNDSTHNTQQNSTDTNRGHRHDGRLIGPSTSINSATDATVIEIEPDQHFSNSAFPRTRRRSNTSSMPATPTVINEELPINGTGDGVWYYNSTTENGHNQSEQGPTSPTNNNVRRQRSSSFTSHHFSGTGDINTTFSSNNDGQNPENSVDSDDEDVTTLILRLSSIRNLIVAYFRQSNNREFSNLYGYYVLSIFLLVSLMLTLQFLFNYAGACFALLLGFLHYQDVSRFCRCISGISDVYFTMGAIFLRNFIILHVLGKTFILKMITFHEQITYLHNPSIFTVIYHVVSAELFLMDCILFCKILVFKIPFMSKSYKRRLYQWLEYTGMMIRFPIPLFQWVTYFNSLAMCIVYILAKFVIGISMCWVWFRATLQLLRYSHLGTKPSTMELQNAEKCIICHGEFDSDLAVKNPVKLKCGHIFCSDCIRTWLDREVTCPMCRAKVTKEDNNFRNGNTIFPMHIF